MDKAIIKTNNLTKAFGKTLALDNLNLEVFEGEVFGYLGPNGAGKSTTIRLLLNIINPTSGEALIFGKNPKNSITDIINDIGYLPGEVHLYENLTGLDHLKYQAQLRTKIDWKYVLELAERFSAQLHKPIKALSHGNKQKIAIVAAFMAKPKLLILDEPTTGLDPLVQRQFYELVEESNRNGATIFLSSHILPEVERICHRVGFLREGKLIVTEEIEKLKSKAVRPLNVQFAKNISKTDFQNIPGVQNVAITGNLLHCEVVGSLDKFVKALAKFEVVNIVTEEPDLEQIFLNYYIKK